MPCKEKLQEQTCTNSHWWQWQSAVVGDANIAPGGQLGRNVVIGICGDGVNPFKHKNYSMWPLAVACFNLPGHLRMTLPAMGLLFFIPPHGPKRGEPNDFQPFLDIIADQLRHAYWYGRGAWMAPGGKSRSLTVLHFYLNKSIKTHEIGLQAPPTSLTCRGQHLLKPCLHFNSAA